MRANFHLTCIVRTKPVFNTPSDLIRPLQYWIVFLGCNHFLLKNSDLRRFLAPKRFQTQYSRLLNMGLVKITFPRNPAFIGVLLVLDNLRKQRDWTWKSTILINRLFPCHCGVLMVILSTSRWNVNEKLWIKKRCKTYNVLIMVLQRFWVINFFLPNFLSLRNDDLY